MKLKIFKIVLIICVILFVFLGTVLAAEEENSVSGTQVSTVTSVTSLSNLPEANLGLNNILNILLIAIGVLLILFAIAILIRLKK